MQNSEKEFDRAHKWLVVQVWHLDPEGSGIVIFTYGTPDYMVSGRAADRLKKKLAPTLKKRYPNYTFIFLPFYMKLEGVKGVEDEEEEEEETE